MYAMESNHSSISSPPEVLNKKEFINMSVMKSNHSSIASPNLGRYAIRLEDRESRSLCKSKKANHDFLMTGPGGDQSYIYLIIFFLQAVRGESGASSLALPSSFPSPLLSPALSFILKQYTFKKYIRIFYYANFVVIFRERLEEILHKKCYLSDCLLKCC